MTTPVYNILDTWNDAGVTYAGIKLNVTNTASNAASKLIDLQVGGSTKFNVDRNGQIYAGYGLSLAQAAIWADYPNALQLSANSQLSWSTGATGIGASAALRLALDATAVLAQRNGTAAQTYRVYETYTDASNYSRGYIKASSTSVEVGSEAAGTGTKRNIVLNGANRAAYDASPSATTIRDILISHGLMAAS